MIPPSELVIIRWRDCFTGSGTWTEASAPPDASIIINSVGWILPNHKRGYLVLTDAWFEREGALFYGTLTYIPKRMVVSKVPLE